MFSTHQKALAINLAPEKYGTFAEIGAGQEVVRWFFRVGGAAGTVAKSVSAYDMQVSDAIYGKSDRYVSRQRLDQMLDHEFSLNLERLSSTGKKIFAFADTVAARSFAGTGACHGWMGIRFQHAAHAEPSQIIIHVQMHDKENFMQQEAIGAVGVNLIYGAFHLRDNPTELLKSLMDNLSSDRIHIDLVEFRGPGFAGIDNRLMAVLLVTYGLSEVAMFAPDGRVLQPTETLYKRSVLVERGSFRPVTKTHVDILESAKRSFEKDVGEAYEPPVVIMEMAIKNLLETGELDALDFLARADMLGTLGHTVLVTNYPEYHGLASYIRRWTTKPCGFALGVGGLRELFEERYYEQLEGGTFEGLGLLFKGKFKLYVYPVRESSGELTTTESFAAPEALVDIYRYLVKRGVIVQVDDFDPTNLTIFAADIRRKILSGDESWERYVLPQVAQIIRDRQLFGYGAPKRPTES